MLPSRGRPGIALMMEVERELTAADIERLALDPTISKVAPPTIQRLKDRHHAIARHLAAGRTVIETAALVGLTPQRVGDLERTDPAFGELLAYYRTQVAEIGLDDAQEFQGKYRDIGRTALEEIQERLQDDGQRKKMSIEELRRLAADAADRTVAPSRTAQPVATTPTKITFNMGPRRLEPKTIDGESKDITEVEIETES